MSNETGSYECEYCGTEFDSGGKKAGHISQNHRKDQHRDKFIHELQRLATELGHSPTMSDMDEEGAVHAENVHHRIWNLERCTPGGQS